MPIALRSSTSSGADTFANSKVIAVPAGAAVDDIAILTAETWTSGAEPTVTNWGTGFTEITGAHVTMVTSSSPGNQSVRKAWKRLTAGDTGNYTVTFSATTWNAVDCEVWSGGLASGDPIEGSNTATGSTGYPTTALTPATAAGMSNSAGTTNAVTTTPPTGFTERQDHDTIHTNTMVATAGVTVTASGGTVSANAEICVSMIAIKPLAAAGGLGFGSEADAGQPVGRVRTTTAGVATETDAGQPVGRIRTTTAITATEVDAAQAISSIRTTTAGAAAETDTAQPIGRTRTTALGAALETELALGPGGGGGTPAGAALEVDAGQPVGRIRTTTVTLAAETDAAQPVGRIRTTSLGAALETDQGQPIGSTRTTLLGPALETDTAQAVQGPNPPASNFRLAGRVESPWQAAVEPGRYAVEVEA